VQHEIRLLPRIEHRDTTYQHSDGLRPYVRDPVVGTSKNNMEMLRESYEWTTWTPTIQDKKWKPCKQD